MNVPRSSWILFVLYLIISIVVLMGSFISPVVRQFSYAPLRELILPPPQPIVVKLLYSTEKEAWLTEEIKNFYATDKRVNGRPIKIEAAEMGSRELILDVLDGNRQPVLISPASSLQVSILQDLSTSKFGYALVNAADRQVCKPVLNTPLVLAAWRERANVLWGDSPSSINIWKQLHDAVSDPAGWASRGHAEWGYVKFGHTSPLTSNSGFMTLVSLTFDYFGKTSALNPDDILSNPDYKYWLLGIEDGVNRFGDSTGTYMKDMIAYGPSMYDVITVYEATAIEQADNAIGRYGDLRVYYPPLTIMSDHPFCIVQGDWVKPEEASAANIFIDFLLSHDAQETALMKYGFRPVDTSIPLDAPGSPLNRYASNGLNIDLPPQAELPAGNVLNTLLDFWIRNVNH